MGAGAVASVSLLAAAAVTALPESGATPPANSLAVGPYQGEEAVPALAGLDRPVSAEAPAQSAAAPAEIPVAPATQAPAEKVPAPVRVVVDGSPIDMPVVPVGVEDNGAMTIPDNHVELGWYRYGPSPGADEGAAVVAGHVDTLTEVTPMAQLEDVPVGAEVRVERADGSVQRYRTESVQHVHKKSLAEADLFRRTGEPVLHLVTCGGEWLEEIGDYEDNVVLRAVPVP
ncbi:class F sortase [Streptomyces sp.]|uniref:class F sortase n=1 Tax=Streptomyces sp. TaxID=1931 RepID=UPI002810C42D|nr:class F sortase [Streptomyces sp.]